MNDLRNGAVIGTLSGQLYICICVGQSKEDQLPREGGKIKQKRERKELARREERYCFKQSHRLPFFTRPLLNPHVILDIRS